MYHVKIYSIGKTKEPWLKEAIDEYSKRLTKTLSIEWVLAKNDEQLSQFLKQSRYIALDPKGKMLTSEAFSQKLQDLLIAEGCNLSFVIGGAEGLEEKIKMNALFLLSFSPMTFTHQITRLVLIEQLYRALEISKGSSYHK